jgi:hypothetical protein
MAGVRASGNLLPVRKPRRNKYFLLIKLMMLGCPGLREKGNLPVQGGSPVAPFPFFPPLLFIPSLSGSCPSGGLGIQYRLIRYWSSGRSLQGRFLGKWAPVLLCVAPYSVP